MNFQSLMGPRKSKCNVFSGTTQGCVCPITRSSSLHLGLHIERDGPHTPCNHAKKLKNVTRG